MKKHQSIHPKVDSSSASLLSRATSVEDIDVDDLISQIDRDVEKIMHTAYMENLSSENKQKRDRTLNALNSKTPRSGRRGGREEEQQEHQGGKGVA